jgi:hypothetical protein
MVVQARGARTDALDEPALRDAAGACIAGTAPTAAEAIADRSRAMNSWSTRVRVGRFAGAAGMRNRSHWKIDASAAVEDGFGFEGAESTKIPGRFGPRSHFPASRLHRDRAASSVIGTRVIRLTRPKSIGCAGAAQACVQSAPTMLVVRDPCRG